MKGTPLVACQWMRWDFHNLGFTISKFAREYHMHWTETTHTHSCIYLPSAMSRWKHRPKRRQERTLDIRTEGKISTNSLKYTDLRET